MLQDLAVGTRRVENHVCVFNCSARFHSASVSCCLNHLQSSFVLSNLLYTMIWMIVMHKPIAYHCKRTGVFVSMYL